MYETIYCRCGREARYRVMKRHGLSQPTFSRKPKYCSACAVIAAEKRIQIEKDERDRRIASGNAKDCDVLMGLAEDIREWIARKLEEDGNLEAAKFISSTPIIMNSQYRRILGRAHEGKHPAPEGNRRIEWSLKAYQNAVNVDHGFFRQTLLHEWAHILDYFENGFMGNHGRAWRKWCVFLGIGGAARCTPVDVVSRRIKRYERTEDMDRAIDRCRDQVF